MPTTRTAPVFQVRVIAEPGHARTLMHHLTAGAKQLLGPDHEYRTQTRIARRSGYVRVYLTATRKEERL